MYGPHPDDGPDYPMSQADVMRDQHTEALLLGHGCPFDCVSCDTQAQYEGYTEEDFEEAAAADRRAAREAARAEAIATGRTVKV